MIIVVTMTNQHSSSTSFLARMPPIPNLKGNILESQSPSKKKTQESKERKFNKIENTTQQTSKT